MTTASQQHHAPRWVVPFLAALIAALAAILGFTTASASAAGVAETRVGAFNVAGEVLDQSGSYEAIRGREQNLIEDFRRQGISANKVNGISPNNPRLGTYLNAALSEFGVLL